jgi:uncharacterized protein
MKFLQKLFLAIALTTLVTTTALAQNIPTDIFPRNEGFITDQANLLSPNDKTQIQQIVNNLKTNQGVELAVVTINSLQEYPIEDYALQLGRTWGIGQQDVNSGVLFLIAPNERQTRIEVGYGIEGELTDAQSHWIIQDIIPYFQNDQFSEGILAGVQKIQQTVQGTYIPTSTQQELTTSEIIYIILFIPSFVLIWISGLLAKNKSWWAGGIVGFTISTILSLLFAIGLIALIPIVISTAIGLFIDRAVSTNPSIITSGRNSNNRGGFGGGFGGGRSSGGGFGGGSFGGGGSSGRW